MRAVIFSVVLAVSFGPAVQAGGLGGHGACHQGGHSRQASLAADEPADAPAHAGHHAGHATHDAAGPADADAAPPSTDSKCACGCVCPPGHACSSASAGIASSIASFDLRHPSFEPQADRAAITVAEPSPHTRPPIEPRR